MTHLQLITIEEMRRQGLQIESHDAEQCWLKKSRYDIGNAIHIPGELQELIEKSNLEIEHMN